MHEDYLVTSFMMAWTPTILPDDPGGKERAQLSLDQISRDFNPTSGGSFRHQSPLWPAGGAVVQNTPEAERCQVTYRRVHVSPLKKTVVSSVPATMKRCFHTFTSQCAFLLLLTRLFEWNVESGTLSRNMLAEFTDKLIELLVAVIKA